jgi:hypothetical protein
LLAANSSAFSHCRALHGQVRFRLRQGRQRFVKIK